MSTAALDPLCQPGIAGTNDRLGSTSNLQLAEDIGDVVAHCLWTQHQLFSNRRVGVALCDERQNLTLTLG
jgi:hypothetical protein